MALYSEEQSRNDDQITPESRQRILIADDDPLTLSILQDELESLGEIFTASNGDEALELGLSISPDVAILDIEMPGANGYQVCRELKADPNTQDVSVLFITSYNSQEAETLALEAGGIDFINKPIDIVSCALRISNHLKMRYQAKMLEQATQDIGILISHLPIQVTLWTSDWQLQYNNKVSRQWDEVIENWSYNQNLGDVFDSRLAKRITQSAKKLNSENTSIAFEESTYWKDTTQHHRIVVSKRKQLDSGHGYLVTLSDISELKNSKVALEQEKEMLRITLNSIGDAVLSTDVNGRVTFMNPIAEKMTGIHSSNGEGLEIEKVMDLRHANSHEPQKNPIRIALAEKHVVGMELNSKITHVNGDVFRVEDSAAPIFDSQGYVRGAIMVFRDVSESVAMSLKMTHMAHHDQLTDLPNRVLFQDRLQACIEQSHAENLKTAVILIDIDHFKYLNDSLGHSVGDELISAIAKRIKSVLPAGADIARLGGDEFAIAFSGIDDITHINALCSRIITVMKKPFDLNGEHHTASVSMGISVFPDDSDHQESLMRHADSAMYRAKEGGRGRYYYFAKELESQIIDRKKVEISLRKSIDINELQVVFQPKVELHSGEVVGAEALCRLRDDSGEYISPVKFIKLAEEIGVVYELGRQVFEKTCAQIRDWRDSGLVNIPPISVNVTASQIASADFIDLLWGILDEYNVPASQIEIEVTESALIENVASVKSNLSALHDKGIRIAIDDFGTGYSSLSYLKSFNVDILKIDQSFVRDMVDNQNDRDIVNAVVSLGKALELELVAEGIETDAQANLLLDMGCVIGQGFLYSKPVFSQEFGQNWLT